MSKDKQEKQAILAKKKGKLATALNNSLIQLRKMGIQAEVIVRDEDPDTGYLIIPIEDLRKVIERKCKKAIEKGARGVEIVTYREEDILVVRVRK